MKSLTQRQQEVVRLILEGQKAGNTPTLFELAEKLGVSSRQTVKDLLDAIAKKGYLIREPRRPRAIMLKPEAIREVEKTNPFRSIQLGLGLAISQGSNAFHWNNPTNIIINHGMPSSNLDQTLIDSSSLIPLTGPDGVVIEEYLRFQMVAEKSNFDSLQDSTAKFLTATYQPLVVTPIMPQIENETGYLFIEGKSQYQVVWSGINSCHYYSLGKEYGNTTSVSIMDVGSEQMKLFSQTIDSAELSAILAGFSKGLKSWSHYVDFPIFGAALKKNGEIIFWSKKTARDINDLRYFFLVDITGTTLIGRDRILLRDVSYNFPKSINNSTY